MTTPIYLDNQATTPCDPQVVDAMLPFFTEHYGNAASTSHPYGWKAKEAATEAREKVAVLSGAEPGEVIFTSGATEAINTSLKGIGRDKDHSQLHIVTCATEHTAVLDTCTYLETRGARITRLPVDKEGHIDLDELDAALSPGANLCSIMHANNEIGLIHPIEAIAAICKRHKVPLHVDAAQSFGKIPVRFREWAIDLMSISGHKLYGPKGIGALLIRRQLPPLRLTPLLHGGGHERGFRSGTLNVPGIVGLGKAAELCINAMDQEAARTKELRNQLLSLLRTGIPELLVNGCINHRLPGNLNISLPGIEGQHLLPMLRDTISVSSGSACTSANSTPSHVLAALGVSPELAHSSLRFGIGRFTTSDNVQVAAKEVIKAFRKLSNSN